MPNHKVLPCRKQCDASVGKKQKTKKEIAMIDCDDVDRHAPATEGETGGR